MLTPWRAIEKVNTHFMTDEFYSGNWEGYYSHGEQYSEERRKTKVGFYVKIVLDNGVLNGTCEEYITKVHMSGPAILTGSIDGGTIRFVKQYPYYYEVDEQNKILVDKSRGSFPIHYSGSFDQSTHSFVGIWGIEPIPGKNMDRGDAYLFSGSWTMAKV
jgi:hypothetical protein